MTITCMVCRETFHAISLPAARLAELRHDVATGHRGFWLRH